MQLWLSRRSDVSISEQLVTQIILGILSNDLAPGQRLPSTRELARRFKVHANTVSAGYKKLERDRWVELRHGSGIYVRSSKPDQPLTSAVKLDHLVSEFFKAARKLGFPLSEVRSGLRQLLEMQPPDHFLLIEPDDELAQIAISELQGAVRIPVLSCGLLPRDSITQKMEHAVPLVFPRKERTVRKLIGSTDDLIVLQTSSIPSSLAGWLPVPSTTLVAVASRWPEFLTLARTMLLAAGFHPDSLIFRDATQRNWQRGLSQSAAVVCDVLTSRTVDPKIRVIPFPLIAESSLAEIRRCESFLVAPPL